MEEYSMKKAKKIQLLGIIIVLLIIPAIMTSAACSHEQKYWDISYVRTYQYLTYTECGETTHYEIECKICSEMWTDYTEYTVPHNWIEEDLGHISGQPLHRYENSCSQCGYSIITDEFCPLMH
jgi:hypothetical protein